MHCSSTNEIRFEYTRNGTAKSFYPPNVIAFLQMSRVLNLRPFLEQIPPSCAIPIPSLRLPESNVALVPSATTKRISSSLFHEFDEFITIGGDQVSSAKPNDSCKSFPGGAAFVTDQHVHEVASASAPWIAQLRDITRGVIESEYTAEKLLRVAIEACLFMPDTPPWALEVMAWIQHGLLPLGYRGTHPHGVWYVMALPHASAEVVAAVAARPADLSRFEQPKVVKIPAYPDIDPVPRSAWDALVGSPPPRDRLLAHLGVYAQTPACTAVLQQVVDRVRAVEIVNDELVLVFPQKQGLSQKAADIRDQRTREHYGEHIPPWVALGIPDQRLALAAPYRGPVKGLPRSLAAALRCHGSAVMPPGTLDTITWYPYANGIFHPEMDVMWDPEAGDRDNPLGKRPLGVLSDSHQVWVLHPRHAWAPGEWSAACIDGETGALNPPLPFGIGGAFLRLLRWAVCPGGTFEGLLRP